MTKLEAWVYMTTKKHFKEHIKVMVDNKETTKSLALRIGVSDRTVRNYARRYGLRLTKARKYNSYWAWGDLPCKW